MLTTWAVNERLGHSSVISLSAMRNSFEFAFARAFVLAHNFFTGMKFAQREIFQFCTHSLLKICGTLSLQDRQSVCVVVGLYEATTASTPLRGLRAMCSSFWPSLSVAWHVHWWIQSSLLPELSHRNDNCRVVDGHHRLVNFSHSWHAVLLQLLVEYSAGIRDHLYTHTHLAQGLRKVNDLLKTKNYG